MAKTEPPIFDQDSVDSDPDHTDAYAPGRDSQGVPGTRLVLWIAALVAIVAGIFWYNREDNPAMDTVETPLQNQELTTPEPVTPTTQPQRETNPDIGPVVSDLNDSPVAPEEPLPALNESDEAVLGALAGVAAADSWLDWLQPEELVRKIAAIVDSAARGEVARKDLALPKPGTAFAAIDAGETAVLDEAGYARYNTYIEVLNAVDTDTLAVVYRYYLPLFEEAYAELGYSDRTFDSSLKQALDNVLQTPQIEGDIELTTTSVIYEFADPELEALPPLTKQIIRMGPRNSQIFLQKVAELKASLSDTSD